MAFTMCLSIYLCVWISVHCSLTNFRIKMVAWNDCLHSVFVSDKRLKTLVFGQKLCEITTLVQKIKWRFSRVQAPTSNPAGVLLRYSQPFFYDSLCQSLIWKWQEGGKEREKKFQTEDSRRYIYVHEQWRQKLMAPSRVSIIFVCCNNKQELLRRYCSNVDRGMHR